MNKKLENICRVCLNIGSRNIFEKSSTTNDSQFSIPAIGENVSSLDRLVEKLRYVTMLKVDECENLPKNMCDSCIIQLNVAYNLKKNAIQSDLKLRQYMIEFGMNVTSYTACSINTVSMMRPPAILMPASTTSESVTITTAKSTTVGPVAVPVSVQLQQQPKPPAQQQKQQTNVQQQKKQQQPPPPPPQQQQLQKQPQPPPPPPPLQVHRPFPVMPIIIKEEPVDYEVMSDITVETNAEAFENRNGHHANGIRSTISTSSSSNKSLTPLPIHSMVSINPVNSKSLLMSTQTASDSEYISAYILTPSSNSDKTTTKNNTATKLVAKRKSPVSKSISLAVPKLKQKQNPSKSSTLSSSSSPAHSPRQQNKQRNSNSNNTSDESVIVVSQHSPVAKRSREIDRLFDDSLIQNKSLNESAGRQTRQKLKTVEPNTNGLQQQNKQQPQQQQSTPKQQQQPRSRSRNSTPKMDYKSFFSVRELKRRLSLDHSAGARRKITTAKTVVNNKIKSPSTVNRKRGSPMSQSRARI